MRHLHDGTSPKRQPTHRVNSENDHVVAASKNREVKARPEFSLSPAMHRYVANIGSRRLRAFGRPVRPQPSGTTIAVRKCNDAFRREDFFAGQRHGGQRLIGVKTNDLSTVFTILWTTVHDIGIGTDRSTGGIWRATQQIPCAFCSMNHPIPQPRRVFGALRKFSIKMRQLPS